nr:hypothetical protein [Tanacetum cinerariifolium]
SALHNDIMEAGSKDHPPMLTSGSYAQRQSRITIKCIVKGPFEFRHITFPAIPTDGDIPTQKIHVVKENYDNVNVVT